MSAARVVTPFVSAVAVSLLVVPLVLAEPASASGETVSDPAGDAINVGDITSLRVSHESKAVRITTRFDGTPDLTAFLVRVDGKRKPSYVITWWDPDYSDGTVGIQTIKQYRSGTFNTVCDVRTGRQDSQQHLTLKAPRRCLKVEGRRPVRIKVKEQTIGVDAYPDGVADATRWTRWLPAGR